MRHQPSERPPSVSDTFCGKTIIVLVCFSALLLRAGPAHATNNKRCIISGCSLWQYYSTSDLRLFDEYYIKPGRYYNLRYYYESLDKTQAFLQNRDGWRFANGRILRKNCSMIANSRYMLMNYLESVSSDCETAKKFRREIQKQFEENPFIYGINIPNSAYDPIVDSELYEISKKMSFFQALYLESAALCKPSNEESTEIDLFEADKIIDDAFDAWNAVEAAIDVSEKDEAFYENYLIYTSDAFNLVRTDPATSEKSGADILDYLKKYDGWKFKNKAVLQTDSTLKADALTIIFNALDRQGKCGEAGAKLDEISSLLKSDFQVVDYFYFQIYDSSGDPDMYEKQKERFRKILRNNIIATRCFAPEKLDEAFGATASWPPPEWAQTVLKK